MSSKEQGKASASESPDCGGEPRNQESSSWEEHADRAQAAVRISTSFFLALHSDNIEKSSSETAARNSYVSGMIDMLTVARAALGFWGADQIIRELERQNVRRQSQDLEEGDEDIEVPEDEEILQIPHGSIACQSAEEEAEVRVRRDPMFA